MAQIILDSNNNLIQGDFDNATVNNRTKFKTTTTNATTNVYAVPNGSATSAGFTVTNAADPTNASKLTIATNGSTDTQIISGVNGSGTYLPLSFYTNNALAAQISTAGVFSATGGIAASSMPAGSVLQVVYGSYNTTVTTTSTSYVDTGLSASITPSSSSNKILVFFNHPEIEKGNGSTSALGGGIQLLRNSSSILVSTVYVGYNGVNQSNVVSSSSAYLDSPATTSSITYKTQFKISGATGGPYYLQPNGSYSTIVLMEIKV